MRGSIPPVAEGVGKFSCSLVFANIQELDLAEVFLRNPDFIRRRIPPDLSALALLAGEVIAVSHLRRECGADEQ
jgi:hypothetical protein